MQFAFARGIFAESRESFPYYSLFVERPLRRIKESSFERESFHGLSKYFAVSLCSENPNR